MHKTETKEDEVLYEATFDLPEAFGNVGAVLVQNEDHNKVFLKSIVLDGFPNGPLHFTCDSWIQPKSDSPVKRVFFSDKVIVTHILCCFQFHGKIYFDIYFIISK